MGNDVIESGEGSPSKRLLGYDVVRVVAMLFVIAVHSLVVVDTSTTIGAYYLSLGQSVFFTANALFFMMSGRFNLTERAVREPLRFYLKKARGILIPVLLLFLVRTFHNLWPDFGSVGHFIKVYARNTLSDFGSMEYWFVFQLISLLVVSPFLAMIVTRLSCTGKRLLFGLGIAWAFLLFVASNRGIELSWSFLFDGFCFTFLIGPFVEELFCGRAARRALWCLGLLCPPLMAWLFMHGVSVGAFDESPLYVLLSVALLVALARHGNRLRGAVPTRLVSFVARHSFTVYLVHMMVLTPLSRMLPSLGGFGSFGMHWVLTLLTFGLSLGIAALVDLVLVCPAQRLFDIIVEKLGWAAARGASILEQDADLGGTQRV